MDLLSRCALLQTACRFQAHMQCCQLAPKVMDMGWQDIKNARRRLYGLLWPAAAWMPIMWQLWQCMAQARRWATPLRWAHSALRSALPKAQHRSF